MKLIKKTKSGYFINVNKESLYYQRLTPDTMSGDPLTTSEIVITHLCECMLNIKDTERKRLRELVDTVWSHVYEDESVPSTSLADTLIDKVFKSDG